MAKRGLVDYTEATVNVILANLLSRRALRVLGEVKVHSETPGRVKKPDILLTVNGIRVIIEGKFDEPGMRSALEKKCWERIEDGLCDVCVGVLYPRLPYIHPHPNPIRIGKQVAKSPTMGFYCLCKCSTGQVYRLATGKF